MYALVPDCLLLQPFVSRACISGRKAGVKPSRQYFAGLFQNDKDSAYFDNRLLGMGRVLFCVSGWIGKAMSRSDLGNPWSAGRL